MTVINGTFYTQATTKTTHTVTVPAGVTSGMYALFVTGQGDGVAVTVSYSTSGSGTLTALDSGTTSTNTRATVWGGTGFVAGDTVTFTYSTAKAVAVGHSYRDDISAFGTLAGAVRPASQATTTSGSVTPASGQLVLVVAVDRTTTTPTISSVTASGGETVTQRDFQHSPGTQPVVGVLFAEFTASAAAARTATVTYSGGSTNGYAAAILVTSSASPGTFSTATGSATAAGNTGTLHGDVTPVERWLALPTPYYAAHRGGSDNWPEMTMYAYRQAAAWNADLALEVSVWRSSDGVWVCSHDQTTGRVFGTNLDIPTNTWATLSTLTTTVGGYPICRLQDVLDELLVGNRVILVDNKQNTNVTAFLDFLDAYSGAPGRIISKGYINSVGTANAARLRGYTTWGYLYDADVASNLPTNAGSWDLLGMDVGGTAPNWATVVSYGKPVLGHIIADSTQAATAVSRGAAGLMVSNVTGVVPPSTLQTTTGDAPATGGTSSFTGDATFSTVGAAAPADGGSTSFTASSTFTTTVGDAPADGGSTTFTGGSSGAATFTTTVGDAPAGGGSSSFTGDATFSTVGAAAPADGGSTTLSGTATITTLSASAPADGGSATLTGTATFSTAAAVASADGGVGSMYEAAAITRGTATVTPRAGTTATPTERPAATATSTARTGTSATIGGTS